ncbi:MAG: threonine synthase [Planctomycetes bacterium]|nr:threonine synthase [Planctomycetota bacterium]
MGTVTGLTCVVCGGAAPPSALWCPACGPEGTLDVAYDLDAARAALERDLATLPPGLWRYRALLPVLDDGPRAPLVVGPTPLVRAPADRAPGGLTRLVIKDEGRNPTASFKDRATSVAVARALERGAPGLLCASTGNAASSLAGFCAAAGLRSVILVPAAAPRPKLAQLMVYGATLLPVRGTYDQAFDLSLAAAPHLGLDLRSTGVNPYLGEGKKTAALELAEQLGWDLPEWVAVSVGDGCIIGGLHKGFVDLWRMGKLPRVPRLLGVQAEGSAALHDAWARGLDRPEPASGKTLADSISVSIPRDARKALRAVRDSGGRFVTVSDDEILEAQRLTARSTGVFTEPAGAAAVAGLVKLARAGDLDPEAPCVALCTGSGLKDAEAAFKAGGAPPDPVEPTLEAVLARLGV